MRDRVASRARRALGIAAPLALTLALLGGTPTGAAAAPSAAPADTSAPVIAILCYHDLSRDSTAPLQTV